MFDLVIKMLVLKTRCSSFGKLGFLFFPNNFDFFLIRYKDESDYALRYMESSLKEQQKEEAKR